MASSVFNKNEISFEFHDPINSKDILSENKLKKLHPYILKLLDTFGSDNLIRVKDRLKIVKLTNLKAAFEFDGVDNAFILINTVQKICNLHLCKKVLVPRYGFRSSFKEQPMQFEIVKNQMIVKFTPSSYFNFDDAIEEIAKLYK